MKALQKYVDHMNWKAMVLKLHPVLDLSKLDDEMAQKIFNSLDSDLSPENLTCDGELPHKLVMREQRRLCAAVNELLAAGYTPARQHSEFQK